MTVTKIPNSAWSHGAIFSWRASGEVLSTRIGCRRATQDTHTQTISKQFHGQCAQFHLLMDIAWHCTCSGWHLHPAKYYFGIYFDGFSAWIIFFGCHLAIVTITFPTFPTEKLVVFCIALLVCPHSTLFGCCVCHFLFSMEKLRRWPYSTNVTMVLYYDYPYNLFIACNITYGRPSPYECSQYDSEFRLLAPMATTNARRGRTDSDEKRNAFHFFFIKYFRWNGDWANVPPAPCSGEALI